MREAMSRICPFNSWAARCTATPWTKVARLPEVGPASGVLPVSAATTRICSGSMPNSSAATWVTTVMTPWPMSQAPE